MNRVTIKDVAHAAGVTPGVVSTVLNKRNNSVGASEETRKRIIEAARRLNFTPNPIARGFQAQRSFLIGLLTAEVNAPLLQDLITSIGNVLEESDFSLVVASQRDFETQQSAVERLLHRRVDGLIVTGAVDDEGKTDKTLFAGIQKQGVPLVEIFGHSIPDVVHINLDGCAGTRLGTEHLLQQGHRRIALLTHERYRAGSEKGALHWDAWDQCQGYEAAMQDAGLAPYVVTHPIPEITEMGAYPVLGWVQQGREAVAQLFQESKPSAVVCYSPHVALGLLDGCRSRNMCVPEDVSVSCIGDSEAAQVSHPSLTAIQWPIQDVGRHAIRQLMELIAGRPAQSMKLAGVLQERESVKKC